MGVLKHPLASSQVSQGQKGTNTKQSLPCHEKGAQK